MTVGHWQRARDSFLARRGGLCYAAGMRLPILLFVATVVPGIARAALPGLAAAEREFQDKRIEPAIERFLDALEGLPAASPDERQRVLRGLLAACREALRQSRFDAAARGLMGLLRPTRDEPLGPAFSAEVRDLLQEVATGLLFFQQPRAAVFALSALMEDSPGNAARWALLSGALLGVGEFARAEETVRRGLELFPEHAELLTAKAQLAQALSYQAVERASYAAAEAQLRQAERDLAQAATRQPQSGGIRLALGGLRNALLLFCSLTGQSPEAGRLLLSVEEDLELAAHLDPRNPAPLRELALLLILSGDWEVARQKILAAQGLIEARLRAQRDPPGMLLSLQGMRQGLTRNLDGVNYRLALEDINLARFDRAEQRISQALRDNPGFADQAARLRWLLSERRERMERELERIRDLPAPRDRAVEMGDLMFRLQRFDEAGRRYGEALAAPPGGYSDDEIKARQEDTRADADVLRQSRLVIGSLDVRLDDFAGADTVFLAGMLERAWALLSARLEQRPRGPLHLALFPNPRSLLERVSPGRWPQYGGSYTLGQVSLAADPRRGRREWTDTLLHALVIRGVDEASFGHAPRWLAEGIAAWACREWKDDDEVRLRDLVRLGRVPARLVELETAFVEYWNEPEITGILRLTAEHLVRWLIERYGAARLNVLLSALRQRTPWDQALRGVYGMDPFALTKEWRESLDGPLYADPPSKRTK